MKKYTFYVVHYLNEFKQDEYMMLDTRCSFQIHGLNKDAIKKYISATPAPYNVHYMSIPHELKKYSHEHTTANPC